MKNIKIFIGFLMALGLVFGVAAYAQTSPLQASMLGPVTSQSYTVNQPVAFGAAATGGQAPYVYNWNFGDNTTGGGQSFDKTFSDAGTRTITLTVTDFSGATSIVTRTITINPVQQTNPVTVELKVNGVSATNVNVATSSQFTLSWTSTNATACTATGNWTGSKAVNGSEILTSPAATSTSQTFTLSCTGANNTSGSDTITITTFGDTNPTGPLVITNVRVTDVTSNSAILRWTTNRVASSRALYDTTSHASISGQSAPNYSYASSTGTSDVDTKVIEHAVSITGLSANTTYYFRAVSQE